MSLFLSRLMARVVKLQRWPRDLWFFLEGLTRRSKLNTFMERFMEFQGLRLNFARFGGGLIPREPV